MSRDRLELLGDLLLRTLTRLKAIAGRPRVETGWYCTMSAVMSCTALRGQQRKNSVVRKLAPSATLFCWCWSQLWHSLLLWTVWHHHAAHQAYAGDAALLKSNDLRTVCSFCCKEKYFGRKKGKIFWSEKILVGKKFWLEKNFGRKKILVGKKIWSEKNFGRKKNFGWNLEK